MGHFSVSADEMPPSVGRGCFCTMAGCARGPLVACPVGLKAEGGLLQAPAVQGSRSSLALGDDQLDNWEEEPVWQESSTIRGEDFNSQSSPG